MPAPPTATGDEIDLADLPPLDGEEGDESPEADDSSVGDDRGPEAAVSDLDDSTGEDDAPHPDDVQVDSGEGGWLEEPADAPGLAIGSIEIDDVDGAPSALGSDDGAPADERDAAEVDPVDADGLDSGEEGTDGPDEELRRSGSAVARDRRGRRGARRSRRDRPPARDSEGVDGFLVRPAMGREPLVARRRADPDRGGGRRRLHRARCLRRRIPRGGGPGGAPRAVPRGSRGGVSAGRQGDRWGLGPSARDRGRGSRWPPGGRPRRPTPERRGS